MPKFAVLQLSDSFASLWPKLAGACELIAEPGPTVDTCLIAAGRIEDDAPVQIARAQALGITPIIVVGAAADHRIAVQLVLAGASDYFALPRDVERLRAWFVEIARRAYSRVSAQALVARER